MRTSHFILLNLIKYLLFRSVFASYQGRGKRYFHYSPSTHYPTIEITNKPLPSENIRKPCMNIFKRTVLPLCIIYEVYTKQDVLFILGRNINNNNKDTRIHKQRALTEVFCNYLNLHSFVIVIILQSIITNE